MRTNTAFVENQWSGRRLQIGTAVIKIVDDVGRCAAINVDPETAKRQANHLTTMRQNFGHCHLGVFGQVIKAGMVQSGISRTTCRELIINHDGR